MKLRNFYMPSKHDSEIDRVTLAKKNTQFILSFLDLKAAQFFTVIDCKT